MVNIKGATVVITGGQRGLGKAIVDEFLSRVRPRSTPPRVPRSPAPTPASSVSRST